MKKAFVALAFLVAGAAHATEDFRNFPAHKKCTLLAGMYSFAIEQRNMGLSPQHVLGASGETVPADLRKAIINQVYFDPKLRYAVTSRDFSYDLIQRCLHGAPKPFEPLQ